MNTIRHARKRPRVRSMNFRALWWMLVREAFVTALDLPSEIYRNDGRWRRHVAMARTQWVQRALEVYLERHPERRIVR